MNYQTVPSSMLNKKKSQILKMVKKGMTLRVINAKTKKELFIISPPQATSPKKHSITDLTDSYVSSLIDLTEYEIAHPYEISIEDPVKYSQSPVARYRN
ncbi:MAG: hypothetical protein H7230_02580 [Candidatus Parcubacteria bacterium]|nr:hypothetical protein [Candidatus Paceibacterota bacterium]